MCRSFLLKVKDISSRICSINLCNQKVSIWCKEKPNTHEIVHTTSPAGMKLGQYMQQHHFFKSSCFSGKCKINFLAQFGLNKMAMSGSKNICGMLVVGDGF